VIATGSPRFAPARLTGERLGILSVSAIRPPDPKHCRRRSCRHCDPLEGYAMPVATSYSQSGRSTVIFAWRNAAFARDLRGEHVHCGIQP
jgi:hypothetical protein